MRNILLALVLPTSAMAHAEPTTAIATDPVGLVHESYSLSIMRAVSHRFAVRADATITPDTATIAGPHQLGVSAPIYLDRPFHGPFVDPGILVRRQPNYYGIGGFGNGAVGCLGCMTSTTITFGPQISVGWQFTCGSGLTLAAAVGAARTWASTSPGVARQYPVIPTSYLHVGYAW
jgi:hypothetical protein